MICHWADAAARQDHPAGLTPTDTALSQTHRSAVSCLTAFCPERWEKCSSSPVRSEASEWYSREEGKNERTSAAFSLRRTSWKAGLITETTQQWKETKYAEHSPTGMKRAENSSSRTREQQGEGSCGVIKDHAKLSDDEAASGNSQGQNNYDSE